ncbi:MAG TPA: LytTR family DNA-binding domain-containing protein [Oscillospiraceae bacterium]|nr:LytTR family DNA-binding domain-containing protein [Oscillospiraceae bacterium]
MVRIAVVEDEAAYTQQITEYLERFSEESGEAVKITVFSDGDEIVEAYKAQFDIILLDIQMRFMDGMTAAKEIRKADPEVVIIFITNMVQYAVQGYSVDALDFVLKPISYFALSQRLEKALDRIKKRPMTYVAVSTKSGTYKLEASKIYYIESLGHNLMFHTASGEYSSTGTLKEWEKKLKDMHFFRGNSCYLINLEHVDGIQDGCALVKGEKLALSRNRKTAFMEALANYVCEVER